LTDPVSGVSRTFNELLDRQVKLTAAADMFCGHREFREKKPRLASRVRHSAASHGKDDAVR
jgi:hypothetical protein